MAARHHPMQNKPSLQLLGLLLLLLDLGLQGVAEGLRLGAVGGESGLVLLLPGFSHLGS